MGDNVISVVALIIMNAIVYALLMLFFNRYFHAKVSVLLQWVTGVTFIMLLTIINLQHNAILNIITAILLVFVNALLVFRGATSKKFAFALLFSTITCMSEMLVTFVMTILMAMSIQIAVENIFTYLLSGFGGIGILLLVLRFLMKKYPTYYELDRGRDVITLSLFPGASLITTIVILKFDKELSLTFWPHLLTVGMLIFFLYLSVSIFFIYHSAINKNHLENELRLNEEIKHKSQMVFQQQNEEVRKISILQHEYMRHFKMMDDFLASKKYDELDLYIKEILYDSQRTKIPILVDFDNFTLSALYGRLMQQCEDQGIDFTADIQYRRFRFISEIDANIIFGNLFDNALEACSQVPKEIRRIKFTVSKSNNFVLISIINSKSHAVCFSPNSDTPLSTKREYNSEGYGIKNVRLTLEKYHGYLTTGYAEDEFTSVVWLEIIDTEKH